MLSIAICNQLMDQSIEKLRFSKGKVPLEREIDPHYI